MRSTIYVEDSVLHFPGTATFAWREEVAQALDSARGWFDLDVVLVGHDRLDPLLHAAVHEWSVDRCIFGGTGRPATVYASTVALDHERHPAGHVWLLSTALHGTPNATARDRLAKIELHSTVRNLSVRDDVVTPLVADDLVEVFAGFAREMGLR